MRKIKEVLRLRYGLGLRYREIARSCSIPRSTVANYQLFEPRQTGRDYRSPDLEEEALENLLFPPLLVTVERPRCVLPDFAWMHEQLRRHKHVTLQLLDGARGLAHALPK